MDVATLDLGSNSFHVLVGRVSNEGIQKLGSRKHVLRIGAPVQSTGRIPETTFLRGLAAVQDLVQFARSFRGTRIVAVGTSALREAANGLQFVRAVEDRCNVQVEIVSGGVEGELVFEGAVRSLSGISGRAGVVDIGGGSVELAVGTRDGGVSVASLPLGFLRFGRSRGMGGGVDLPSLRERISAGVRGAVRALETGAGTPEAWVFSGGTARAFARAAGTLRGVPGLSGELSAADVRWVAERLTAADIERMTALGVDPARMDNLGAGAALLGALVEALEIPALRVSPGGLREGLAFREFRLALERRSRPLAPSPLTVTAVSAG